ncbi:MAG: hypothetical protein IPH06_03175 [Alphaproteobacteria bacterium]|nr:hypothetical protein [Alphaproteobacteria bacterium]QQS57042.1 MAG: hypothetical protein IPN28_12425 [Alphaproteobacteria bacterium]
MNPIEKIDRSHRQGLVLHGFCLTLYVILVCVNLNLPFMAQTFAHYTYIPLELENSENPLTCNYQGADWIYEPPWHADQNLAGIPEALNFPEQTYRVGEEEYALKYITYTGEQPCKLEKTIYVSPLNPHWAVSDNRFPSEEIKRAFLDQVLKVLFLICLFITFSCLILKCPPRQISKELKETCSRKSVANSIILFFYTRFLAGILLDIYNYSFDQSLLDGRNIAFVISLIIYLLYVPLRYMLLIPIIWLSFGLIISAINFYAEINSMILYHEIPFADNIEIFSYHVIILLALTAHNQFKNHTKEPNP